LYQVIFHCRLLFCQTYLLITLTKAITVVLLTSTAIRVYIKSRFYCADLDVNYNVVKAVLPIIFLQAVSPGSDLAVNLASVLIVSQARLHGAESPQVRLEVLPLSLMEVASFSIVVWNNALQNFISNRCFVFLLNEQL
jgi:hypothetical protein